MAGKNYDGRSDSVVPRQVGISYGDGGVVAPSYRGGFALAGGVVSMRRPRAVR